MTHATTTHHLPFEQLVGLVSGVLRPPGKASTCQQTVQWDCCHDQIQPLTQAVCGPPLEHQMQVLLQQRHDLLLQERVVLHHLPAAEHQA